MPKNFCFILLFLLPTAGFSQQKNNNSVLKQGKIAFENENWEEAVGHFDTWLSLHPKDEEAYWMRGQSFEYLEEYERSNSDYSAALTLDPLHTEVYFARGRVRHMLGQYEQAMLDFDTFLESEPGETTRVIYSRAPGQKGISNIMTAQNENPAQVYYHMGLSSLELKEYDNALNFFEEALRFQPGKADFYAEIGRAYSKIGDNELAQIAFEEALSIDPDHLIAKQGIATVKAGNDPDLIKTLTEVIDDSSANSQTFKQRGYYQMNNGDLENALKDFSEAIKLDDMDPETFFYRGKVYGKLKSWKEAEKNLSKAIELDPQNPEYFLARGQNRYLSKALQEALADFTIFINLDPENPSAYYHRGITYQRLKEMGLACQDIKKAADLGMEQAQTIWEKICQEGTR